MSFDGVTVMPYGPAPRGARNISTSPVAGSSRPIQPAAPVNHRIPSRSKTGGVRRRARRSREDVDLEVAGRHPHDRVEALVGHPGGAIGTGDDAVRRGTARQSRLPDLAGLGVQPAERAVLLARVPDAAVRGDGDVVRVGAARDAVRLGGENELAGDLRRCLGFRRLGFLGKAPGARRRRAESLTAPQPVEGCGPVVGGRPGDVVVVMHPATTRVARSTSRRAIDIIFVDPRPNGSVTAVATIRLPSARRAGARSRR